MTLGFLIPAFGGRGGHEWNDWKVSLPNPSNLVPKQPYHGWLRLQVATPSLLEKDVSQKRGMRNAPPKTQSIQIIPDLSTVGQHI